MKISSLCMLAALASFAVLVCTASDMAMQDFVPVDPRAPAPGSDDCRSINIVDSRMQAVAYPTTETAYRGPRVCTWLVKDVSSTDLVTVTFSRLSLATDDYIRVWSNVENFERFVWFAIIRVFACLRVCALAATRDLPVTDRARKST